MAGRPPYQITQQDYSFARRYIERAMDRGDISNVSGYMGFRNASDAALLQTWCEDYLGDDIFAKMRRAVRASRKRSRDYPANRKKGIDLSHTAHLLLSSLADDLELTLSETVILLEDTYYKARKANII